MEKYLERCTCKDEEEDPVFPLPFFFFPNESTDLRGENRQPFYGSEELGDE